MEIQSFKKAKQIEREILSTETAQNRALQNLKRTLFVDISFGEQKTNGEKFISELYPEIKKFIEKKVNEKIKELEEKFKQL